MVVQCCYLVPVSLELFLHVLSEISQSFLHDFHVRSESFEDCWIHSCERDRFDQSGVTLILVNKDKQSGEKGTKSHKNDQQRLTLLLQQLTYIYSVNSM